MQDITARMMNRLVEAVRAAERTGDIPHLPANTPAASREAFLRRELIYRNHVQGRWELADAAVGMAEAEIERRAHDAAEEAARPALQEAADRALVAEGANLPDETEFVTVAPARGVRTHEARRADKGLRPACTRTGQVLRTNFLPTDADLTCPKCLKRRALRAERRAELAAARQRLATRAAT